MPRSSDEGIKLGHYRNLGDAQYTTKGQNAHLLVCKSAHLGHAPRDERRQHPPTGGAYYLFEPAYRYAATTPGLSASGAFKGSAGLHEFVADEPLKRMLTTECARLVTDYFAVQRLHDGSRSDAIKIQAAIAQAAVAQFRGDYNHQPEWR
jgi:hypothetical protein